MAYMLPYKKTSRLNSSVLTGYLECVVRSCNLHVMERNVRKLELLQHAWMQNAENADGVVLAAEVDFDSC